jgi:hypothetical protein
VFGSFRRAYRDDYRPQPFSRKFVRYLPGWYAQKHPDEDFAESFAVWLTPRSSWRRNYKGWEALAKLQYVDRVARAVRTKKPARRDGTPDITVSEMETTVAEFYEKTLREQPGPVELPGTAELAEIFGNRKGRRLKSAADLVLHNRSVLVDRIAHWTGVQKPVVRGLVDSIAARLAELNTRTAARLEHQRALDLAIYTTVLAMANLHRRTMTARRPMARPEKPPTNALAASGANG